MITKLPPELRTQVAESLVFQKNESVERTVKAAQAFRTELCQAGDTYRLSNVPEHIRSLVQEYRGTVQQAKTEAEMLLHWDDESESPHPDGQVYLAERLERSVESAKNLRQTIFPGPSVTVREQTSSKGADSRILGESARYKDPTELLINRIGMKQEKRMYKRLHTNIKDTFAALSDTSRRVRTSYDSFDRVFVDKPKTKIAQERHITAELLIAGTPLFDALFDEARVTPKSESGTT